MSTPRNPNNARHECTFRLPSDLIDRLDATARERVLGRSKLVELLLVRALDLLDVPSESLPLHNRGHVSPADT